MRLQTAAFTFYLNGFRKRSGYRLRRGRPVSSPCFYYMLYAGQPYHPLRTVAIWGDRLIGRVKIPDQGEVALVFQEVDEMPGLWYDVANPDLEVVEVDPIELKKFERGVDKRREVG